MTGAAGAVGATVLSCRLSWFSLMRRSSAALSASVLPYSPCWVLMSGAWSSTRFGVVDGGGGAAGSAIGVEEDDGGGASGHSVRWEIRSLECVG